MSTDPHRPTPSSSPRGIAQVLMQGRMAQLRAFLEAHPTLSTFLFLAPGMVAILLWSMQSVPLEPQQRLAMVLATVALAGACAWIISWE